MADRSTRPDVRNPVLRLSAAGALSRLPAETRETIRLLLLELSRDAGARAQQCWTKHKAPMAAYWKAVAVYARHIARALQQRRRTSDERTPLANTRRALALVEWADRHGLEMTPPIAMLGWCVSTYEPVPGFDAPREIILSSVAGSLFDALEIAAKHPMAPRPLPRYTGEEQ